MTHLTSGHNWEIHRHLYAFKYIIMYNYQIIVCHLMNIDIYDPFNIWT